MPFPPPTAPLPILSLDISDMKIGEALVLEDYFLLIIFIHFCYAWNLNRIRSAAAHL